jgi:glycosyltransferase involved in cell wall biosynthesis
MRILVISHEYPPIGGGGGKVVQDLCLGLAERGHQIHLITAQFGDLPAHEQHGNLEIERIRSWRTQPFRADLKAMASFIFRSYFKGLQLARSFKPDLIHAHFAVPAGASALLLSRTSGIPFIITAHGGDVPGGAPEKTAGWFRFALPLSKLIWQNAAAAVAVSEQTRELALEHYKADIHVIPNGIDTQAMKPGNLKVNDPPGILFIGRFSPEKNAVAVPKILENLKHLSWKCEMLGDGIEMNEVRQLIDEHNLDDRISLLGWVDPDSVKEHLEHSDILLMPSLREGMPMAALQGLSMGLALLLPDKGSCPDLIEDNGFVIEPGDLKTYTSLLEKLLTNRKMLGDYKKKSRKLAAKVDIANTIDAYEQIYSEVINKRAA